METRLRTLQIRRDVIRTLNQRRLEGAKEVRALGERRVRGVVVKAGFHDEMGGSPWMMVKDRDGTEHYARLRTGTPLVQGGRTVELAPIGNGLSQVIGPKGRDLMR